MEENRRRHRHNNILWGITYAAALVLSFCLFTAWFRTGEMSAPRTITQAIGTTLSGSWILVFWFANRQN